MISTVTKIYDFEEETNVLEVVYDDGKVSFVPKDESNRHYQEVLQWVADGNTISEPS